MAFILNCQTNSGDTNQYELFEGGIYLCGKSLSVDIHIPDELVSRQHARLFVKKGVVIIEDLNSTNGILFNGALLKSKAKTEFECNDLIKVGNSTLTLSLKKQQSETEDVAEEFILKSNEMLKNDFSPQKKTPQVPEENMQTPIVDNTIEEIQFTNHKFDQEDFEIIKSLHAKTLEHMDLYKRSILHKLNQEELRVEAEKSVVEVLKGFDIKKINNQINQAELVELVVAEAVGLGPLEPLLDDETISEIMVNGYDKIYTEKSGKIFKIDMRFNSNASLMSIIERIVTPIGRRVDEGSPMVDGRLKDGSRVNAIIPPLSLIGPTLTIRKFGKHRFGMEDLLKRNTMSEDMGKFLEVAVQFRKNMIVSGGTGSGKTTTLNVLSNFIPSTERIVTIEDAAELRLNQEHVISLESRPKNIEGKGEVLIRDLVKNSLRMRPDRIVVGECRGGEALDMLQAMNTGHDGSLTTGHANSPRDLLSRLEVMVLMSGVDLPVRAIREQIASAVDVILQQTRFADGSRRVTSIFVIEGMEGDVILMQKLFEFKQHGIDENGKVVGEYMATGQIPQFYSDLEAGGIKMDRSIFLRNSSSQI